jgi:hypothetical protein
MRADNTDTKRNTRQGDRVPVGGDNDGGPTSLRQQSYVGQRPGAYWSAPGVAAVRASASAGRDEEEEAATRNDATRQRPHPSRDPEVLLEAEPVLSILVNATPVPEEIPVLAEEPPMRPRPKRRAIVILLAVGAIAAVAVAAGVILGTASQSSKENSAPPGPSPIPSTTPSRGPSIVGGHGSAQDGHAQSEPTPAPTTAAKSSARPVPDEGETPFATEEPMPSSAPSGFPTIALGSANRPFSFRPAMPFYLPPAMPINFPQAMPIGP